VCDKIDLLVCFFLRLLLSSEVNEKIDEKVFFILYRLNGAANPVDAVRGLFHKRSEKTQEDIRLSQLSFPSFFKGG
jgi:hypothetical protein